MGNETVDGNDGESVRAYLADIEQFPVLTDEDAARLAQAAAEGRKAAEALASVTRALTVPERQELTKKSEDAKLAQQALVQSHLPLVVTIARKYGGTGLPLIELIQAGNPALVHAAERFDGSRGFKFSTYATWWIRQGITRHVANSQRSDG